MAYKDPRQKAFEEKVFQALKNGMDFPLEFKSWLRSYLELNPPAFLPSDLATIISGTDIDVESLEIDRLLAGDIAGDNIQVGIGSVDDGAGNPIRDETFEGIRSFHDGENTFRVDAITGDLFFTGDLGDSSIRGATFAWGTGSALNPDDSLDILSQASGFATPAIVQSVTRSKINSGIELTASCSWAQPTAVGNHLFIAILTEGTAPSAPAGWTTMAVKSDPGTNVCIAVYYRANSSSRSGGETVSLSSAGQAYAMNVVEVSGLTGGVDKASSLANSGSTTPSTGTTATLSQAQEWAFAALVHNSLAAQTSPTFTEIDNETASDNLPVWDGRMYTYGQSLSSTAGISASATLAASTPWAGVIGTFRRKSLSVATPPTDTIRVYAKAAGSSGKPHVLNDAGADRAFMLAKAGEVWDVEIIPVAMDIPSTAAKSGGVLSITGVTGLAVGDEFLIMGAEGSAARGFNLRPRLPVGTANQADIDYFNNDSTATQDPASVNIHLLVFHRS